MARELKNILSDNQTVEWLVQEHYAPIFRLAIGMLEHAQLAHQVTIQILVKALHQRMHFPRHSDALLWLYSLAINVIRKYSRRLRVNRVLLSVGIRLPGNYTIPQTIRVIYRTDPFWQTIEELLNQERLVFLFSYLLGWEPQVIAHLLRVSDSAVQAQLQIFQRKFSIALEKAHSKATHEGALPLIATEPLKADSINQTISEMVQSRWLPPSMSAEWVNQVCGEVLDHLEQLQKQPLLPVPVRILAIVGVLGLFFFFTLFSAVKAVSSYISRARIAPGATPVTPIKSISPLSQKSSDADIRERFKNSPLLWHTAWVAAQFIDYGPASYIGPPRVYHLQAWVSQPSQSLELVGFLSEKPSRVDMILGDVHFFVTEQDPALISTELLETNSWLLWNQRLKTLIFPHSSSWMNQPGKFTPEKLDRWAGRKALVVVWKDLDGNPHARLWLDTLTGIILRVQEYDPSDFQTIVADLLLTKVETDINFPQANLFDPSQLGKEHFVREYYEDLRSIPQDNYSPSLAIQLEKREYLRKESPPAGFNPASGTLSFQFAHDPNLSTQRDRVAEVPIELFSNGYYVGKGTFALPWLMQCDRSPNGELIAFNTISDGISLADKTLHWFNVSEPEKVYQPLPGLLTGAFAFSPDSRYLAVFVLGEEESPGSLYLLDIPTGEESQILSLDEAHSLVWHLNGQFLALIGKLPREAEPLAIVIHIPSRLITHSIPESQLEEGPPSNWPLTSWGVSFPVSMGGMEKCAQPVH